MQNDRFAYHPQLHLHMFGLALIRRHVGHPPTISLSWCDGYPQATDRHGTGEPRETRRSARSWPAGGAAKRGDNRRGLAWRPSAPSAKGAEGEWLQQCAAPPVPWWRPMAPHAPLPPHATIPSIISVMSACIGALNIEVHRVPTGTLRMSAAYPDPRKPETVRS